jgi:hypothetical protein
VLGIELLGWITAWALFKRPAWFHALLLPAFLALPVELYLFAFYGQGISTHHLGIIAETSPAEALEFLGQKVWLLGAVLSGVLAWFGTSLRAAWTTRDLDWNDVSRPVVLAVLALGAGVLGYGYKFGVAPPPASAPVAQARAHCPTGPGCRSTSTRSPTRGHSDWWRAASTSIKSGSTWPT